METDVEVTEDRTGDPLLRKPRTSQLSYACKCWFLRKPDYPGKNLSEQSREPTNSTHIWRRIRESILGHIGPGTAYERSERVLNTGSFCGPQWLLRFVRSCHQQQNQHHFLAKTLVLPRRDMMLFFSQECVPRVFVFVPFRNTQIKHMTELLFLEMFS